MKKAFTLAEVLITLGIIGVVAAITMPALIQNHQKQVYVAGAKKGLSTIQNMFKQIMADEGVTEFAYTLISDGSCVGQQTSGGDVCEDRYGNPSLFEKIIPKYLKVIKVCKDSDCDIKYQKADIGYNSNKLEFWDNNITISEVPYYDYSGVRGFYTADGMIYYMTYAIRNSILVAFDINGKKGPNIFGRDVFFLHIFPNGKIIYSLSPMNSAYQFLNYLTQNGWKMDY